MTARPVSQAGIAKIDQLAEKFRQRGVPLSLLRRTQEILYNASALVMGLSFIMFLLRELSKSVHRFEVRAQPESRLSILGEG